MNVRSFEEFWPYYLSEHRRRVTRALHFAGTTAGLLLLGAAIVTTRPALLVWGLAASYGLAWIGHFFVERNRPATFRHPLWSLAADFKMYGLIWRGKLGQELARLQPSETGNEKRRK